MYDKVGINLRIGIQEFIHPFRAHPAVTLRIFIPAPVQGRACLYDALQIKLIGIQQSMDQGIHVIHFPVLRYKQPGLSFKIRQSGITCKSRSGNQSAHQQNAYQC